MADLPTGTVTFLFTDVEGSTRLWEQHPEAMRRALSRHDALLRRAIEASGGAVFKTMGDEFCAAFATAPDAVQAALAVQYTLRAEEWGEVGPLQVRIAVHTGAAEQHDGDYFGPPLNRIARLLDAAHGGQILLSLAAQELARDQLPEEAHLVDLGERRLKDLARPERIFQLGAPDLPADFPPLKTLDAQPNNLPVQRTPLLGREKEVAAARKLLADREVGLITLIGPGGTGKTRLALQVAAESIDAFADGVYFVALAPISDPTLVGSTIARTLGVREAGSQPLLATLKDYLCGKQILLLLDNFEQVLAAAPLVAELLETAPRLKVLVTSREVLHLRGEHGFPVPPLALPDRRRLPPIETLSQYAAVELFIQRAVAARPDFAVTNANAAAVAEICHRLDGLPLAIELAAARVTLLPPASLLSRLESRLKLLTGGPRDLPTRQQTLRGAIAWSYDLLDTTEKALFRRLAIFVGGCTLETAESVCNAEGDLQIDILDGVASLVDKSLLLQGETPGGEPRLGMLETIREYGRECLEASTEASAVRRHHVDCFLELAEEAEPRLRTAEQGLWLERLEREHDNLRAALAWSQTEPNGCETGLRLAVALWWFCQLHGHWNEARGWLERTLKGTEALEPTEVRAKALCAAGIMAWLQSDYEAARLHLEECKETAQELGDKRELAWALSQLGMLARDQGDVTMARTLLAESVTLFRAVGDPWCLALSLLHLGHVECYHGTAGVQIYEESAALFRAAGDTWGLAHSLNYLGRLARYQNDYTSAISLGEESVNRLREVGDRRHLAWALTDLGDAAALQGDPEQALAAYHESLALFEELREKRSIGYVLERLAEVAASQGQLERAARLLGAVQALLDTVDPRIDRLPSMDPFYAGSYDRVASPTRERLGEETFTAAWSEGRAMGLEQAIAYALCRQPAH